MSTIRLRLITDAYGDTVEYSIVFSDEERRKIEEALRDKMKNLPTPEQIRAIHRHRAELEKRCRERTAMLNQGST